MKFLCTWFDRKVSSKKNRKVRFFAIMPRKCLSSNNYHFLCFVYKYQTWDYRYNSGIMLAKWSWKTDYYDVI